MQYKTIWWIIGIVVVIAIVWYAIYRDRGINASYSLNNSPATSTTTTVANNNTTGSSHSLQSLLGTNNPQLCTFTDKTSTGSVTGTIYVANGDMRGDFTTSNNAAASLTYTHVIINSNYVYTWTDGTGVGIKAPRTSNASQQGIDLNKPENVTCTAPSASVADFSQFVPPKNITFESPSAATQ